MTDREAMEASVAHTPYIRHPDTVRSMMADVLIALVPAFIWAMYSFGARAFSLVLVSVVTAVLSEAAFNFFTKRRATVGDLSAVVTGLLFSFLLPASTPLYAAFIGSAFAILIVKAAFGGIGANILNPALTGYVFVRLCFPAQLAVSGDPLAVLQKGELPNVSLFDMLIGNIPGGIGEVSTLLLFAGGVYLIVRGVIDWRIPTAFIGVVAAVTLLFPNNINGLSFMGCELLSGSLFLVAIFMATDPVTSPATHAGRLIFGAVCGGLMLILRYFGMDPDGAAYAVLTANLLSGVIEKVTAPVLTAAHTDNKSKEQ